MVVLGFLCLLLGAAFNSNNVAELCGAIAGAAEARYVRGGLLKGGLTFTEIQQAIRSSFTGDLYSSVTKAAMKIKGPSFPGAGSCSFQSAVSAYDFKSFRSYCAYSEDLYDPNSWNVPDIPNQYPDEVAELQVAISTLCAYADAGLFVSIDENVLVPALSKCMDYMFSFSLCNQGKSYQYLYDLFLSTLLTAFQSLLT